MRTGLKALARIEDQEKVARIGEILYYSFRRAGLPREAAVILEALTPKEVTMTDLSRLGEVLCETMLQKGIAAGREQGIAAGREQGIAAGEALGRKKAVYSLLRSLLREKFGELPVWAESRLEDITTPEEAQDVIHRLNEATRIEDVLTP
jgi:hypothetical protein